MKRVARYGLVVVVILAAVAFWQRQALQIWWIARKIDLNQEFEPLVQQLAEHDGAAFGRLLELLQRDQAELCDAVAASLAQRCEVWAEKSPFFDQLGEMILAHQGRLSNSGHTSVVGLLPRLLRGTSPEVTERFKPLVVGWLSHTEHTVRLRAILLAQREEFQALEAVLPLLKDSAPEVRRAAMLAVGPAPVEGEPLIETEKLLPWLHDPDAGVRRNCEIALATRGLSPVEIRLSRQITDQNPVERLKLLLQLPEDEEFRIDPWLERLSRDRDSAVRVGAARVALERGLDFEDRLREMLQSDPDPSVRKILEHYGRKPARGRE
jgi:hypothetical protein